MSAKGATVAAAGYRLSSHPQIVETSTAARMSRLAALSLDAAVGRGVRTFLPVAILD